MSETQANPLFIPFLPGLVKTGFFTPNDGAIVYDNGACTLAECLVSGA
ncbi:hypothetical protein [Hydrogenovibrio halophilus]|nr:hypothetical protein [Hydrogenovibrio halophilus]